MRNEMAGYKNQILSELKNAFEALDDGQLRSAVQEIAGAGRVFCDGLGRSGLSMRGFAMRLGQMGRKSALVGEATAPAFSAGDLLLLCTASGTSPVLLYHAQRAKSYGGRVFLITGNAGSPLAKLADGLILVQAPDKDQEGQGRASIQPMGSLFEQVSQLICDLLAVKLMDLWGLTSEEMRKYHANIE